MAYILLKYDDLSQGNVCSFKHVADYAVDNHICCSFGLIGQSLEQHNLSYINTLKMWSAQGIELWNHGYFHTDKEFSENSYDAQVYSLTRTQKLMKKYLGFSAKTFGSPHNNSTETTIKSLVSACPEINNYLFAVDASCHSPAKKLLMRCNYERTTGQPDFFYFIENYNSMKQYPFLVLQGHPSYWGTDEFAVHDRIIEYLAGEGHIFVTPMELHSIELPCDVSDEIGKHAADQLLAYLENSSFSFYGAGEIARELYKFLSQRGLFPKNFVISDSQQIHEKVLCSRPVIHLTQYLEKQEDVLVLALLNTLHAEVRADLEKLRSVIFPDITDASYSHLINYIRYAVR